jgi:hypothetical protein
MAASWTFLTNHARVLLCIARDPAIRLRDIAASLGITERSTYGIVIELAGAGYIVKQKNGRRNRYEIQAHLPLPEPSSRDRTVGEALALLVGVDTDTPRPVSSQPAPPARWADGAVAGQPANPPVQAMDTPGLQTDRPLPDADQEHHRRTRSAGTAHSD